MVTFHYNTLHIYMLQKIKSLHLCTFYCLIYLVCCCCRKDLKFVSDVEKEMRMLVEAVNKVSIQVFFELLKETVLFTLGGDQNNVYETLVLIVRD